MSEQKFIKKMTGYKATDANMKCRDFQFVLGEWAEITGEVVLCENGFHFCEQPSGPWCYYSMNGTRVFKCEAEDVLESDFQPGADYKRVCRRIRLVEEIIPTGDRNTGDRNTGDRNTGDRNTGDRNTGHGNTGHGNTGHDNTGDANTGNRNTGDANTGNRNTGYDNTGDANTGDRNTGYDNTGDANTGDRNTGYGNTGNRNTGNRNTGHRNTGYDNTGDANTGDRNTGYDNTGDANTGDRNTGDRNTGHGNATNYSSGFFCQKDQNVLCFDVDTGMTRDQFVTKFPSWIKLANKLMEDEAICFSDFSDLPGITHEKLQSLHAKHIAARKAT